MKNILRAVLLSFSIHCDMFQIYGCWRVGCAECVAGRGKEGAEHTFTHRTVAGMCTQGRACQLLEWGGGGGGG